MPDAAQYRTPPASLEPKAAHLKDAARYSLARRTYYSPVRQRSRTYTRPRSDRPHGTPRREHSSSGGGGTTSAQSKGHRYQWYGLRARRLAFRLHARCDAAGRCQATSPKAARLKDAAEHSLARRKCYPCCNAHLHPTTSAQGRPNRPHSPPRAQLKRQRRHDICTDHSVIATRTECTGLIKGLEIEVRQSYRDEGADLVNSQLTKRSYTSLSDTFRQFPIDEASPKSAI